MSGIAVRSVSVTTMAYYTDLSDFEHSIIIGVRQMEHNISKVARKFGFSRMDISQVYRKY